MAALLHVAGIKLASAQLPHVAVALLVEGGVWVPAGLPRGYLGSLGSRTPAHFDRDSWSLSFTPEHPITDGKYYQTAHVLYNI